jgi:hypothetical protein
MEGSQNQTGSQFEFGIRGSATMSQQAQHQIRDQLQALAQQHHLEVTYSPTCTILTPQQQSV